jgi:hypothetical protein
MSYVQNDRDVDLVVFIGYAIPQVVGSGLPPWRPRFSPRAVHLGFMVDRLVLCHVVSLSASVFPSVSFHQCCILILPSPVVYNLRS